jgi:disulfide bond formation protein DsbB
VKILLKAPTPRVHAFQHRRPMPPGHIACVVICFQKGKPWFGGIGLLIGWLALIGAIRLAKPGSSWYREYAHDPWKQHQARMRFPDKANMLDVLNAEHPPLRQHTLTLR